MTFPGEEFQVHDRAANHPRPADWVEPVLAMFHTPELGQDFAANGLTFYCDISEFQPPYDSTYPYPAVAFRVFNGYRVDKNAAVNWQQMQTDIATGKLRVTWPYVVFVPGALTATIAGLKAVFGANPPASIRIAPMNDMESGSGFAGPGNHSAEANQWMLSITNWLTSTKKQLGYANAGDWANCWPQHDAALLRVTAAYNAKNPGTYAWQYAGGNMSYPIPSGYPRSVAPFGAYVDINVINRTIDQIEADFGMTAAPAQEDDMPFVIADPVANDGEPGVYVGNMVDTIAYIPDLTSLGFEQAHYTQIPMNNAQFSALITGIINPERASRGWSPYVYNTAIQIWQAAPYTAPTPAPVPAVVSATLDVAAGSVPASIGVGAETIPAMLSWSATTVTDA